MIAIDSTNVMHHAITLRHTADFPGAWSATSEVSTHSTEDRQCCLHASVGTRVTPVLPFGFDITGR